jgi:hypothetical protein
LQTKIIEGIMQPEIHEDPKFEIIRGGSQALKIRKGWMVKGGKKEPSTRSLYRLRGIKNVTPLSESPERGSMDGKGGKRNHPSISKNHKQS